MRPQLKIGWTSLGLSAIFAILYALFQTNFFGIMFLIVASFTFGFYAGSKIWGNNKGKFFGLTDKGVFNLVIVLMVVGLGVRFVLFWNEGLILQALIVLPCATMIIAGLTFGYKYR